MVQLEAEARFTMKTDEGTVHLTRAEAMTEFHENVQLSTNLYHIRFTVMIAL